ncbi:hypothetical protein [Pedobacter alluvionis]|uniref:Uncharacterized protein n=1 Tax=Pedobacter alluvionis TaxID=475253 RepID=A0A497YDL2_9SPHI|nr:hypothetical protein [Pedobacter alluvionis]RLJ80576.1 hypothetical protein BCL90_1360 [Pedobacter alluvionis]TFB31842.1 hypothetical protein E3V97_14790 [Pedobacter alluvionis]
MAKKKKNQFLSLEFKNETVKKHTVGFIAKDNSSNHVELISPCKCGDSVCINGVLHRCMSDPSGECVWFETTEICE